MATAAARKPGPKPEEAPTLEQFAELHRKEFNGKGGRPDWRTMTPSQLQSLDRSYNSGITVMVGIVAEERYDILDSIKPTNMPRTEFIHMILREGARRHVLERVLNRTGFIPRDQMEKQISVRRPSGVDEQFQRIITTRAADVAFYDVAIGTLISPNSASFILQPEVAAQLGLPQGRTNEIILKNDTQVMILGYLVGSNANSFPGTNPAMPAGKLPLSIGFEAQPADLIAPYCSALSNIANPGRDVDQTVALSAGIIMARTDAANGMGNNVELGFNNMSCRVQPSSPWNDNMRIALSGYDKNGPKGQPPQRQR